MMMSDETKREEASETLEEESDSGKENPLSGFRGVDDLGAVSMVPVEISAVLSIDLSDFNGPILNGALEENSIMYKVWKAEEDEVYMAEAEYSVGNGLFGDLFNTVSTLL